MSLELMQKADRLTSHNYPLWSAKVRNMLIMKDLWVAVTQPAPQQESSNAFEVAAFKSKDQKAMAFISLNIEDTHYHMVQNLSTAKEVWERLKQLFQAKSTSRHCS